MGAGEGRTGRVEREEYHLLKKRSEFHECCIQEDHRSESERWNLSSFSPVEHSRRADSFIIPLFLLLVGLGGCRCLDRGVNALLSTSPKSFLIHFPFL